MGEIFIIAEAGVNHNGSLDLAKQLVDVAAESGADAVKFQTFKAERVATLEAKKAAYQEKIADSAESQLDMLKKLELNQLAHEELFNYSRERGIEFLSTPFDSESVEMLVRLGLSRLKISSGEITNGPLLLKAAGTGLPLIVSTGMTDLDEIEAALGVLAFGMMKGSGKPSIEAFSQAYTSKDGQRLLKERVILLHCVTEYPAPVQDANLRAMDTMKSIFSLPVGYSDHTDGITVAVAAAARGAVVVEKHFTLDRNLPGPDHKASLEPEELKKMVQDIRQAEAALGTGIKVPASCELKNRHVRKSLVTAKAVKEGEPFTEENLTMKRPGTGVSPMQYWELLGKPAKKNYLEDEVIEL